MLIIEICVNLLKNIRYLVGYRYYIDVCIEYTKFLI